MSVLQPVFSCTPWDYIRPCVEGPGAVSSWLSCTLHAFPQFSRLLKDSVEVSIVGTLLPAACFGSRRGLRSAVLGPVGLGGDFGAEDSSAFWNSTLWLPMQGCAEAASLGLLTWICLCHVGPMSNAHWEMNCLGFSHSHKCFFVC